MRANRKAIVNDFKKVNLNQKVVGIMIASLIYNYCTFLFFA